MQEKNHDALNDLTYFAKRCDDLRMAMRCCKEGALDRLNAEFDVAAAEYKRAFYDLYGIA